MTKDAQVDIRIRAVDETKRGVESAKKRIRGLEKLATTQGKVSKAQERSARVQEQVLRKQESAAKQQAAAVKAQERAHHSHERVVRQQERAIAAQERAAKASARQDRQERLREPAARARRAQELRDQRKAERSFRAARTADPGGYSRAASVSRAMSGQRGSGGGEGFGDRAVGYGSARLMGTIAAAGGAAGIVSTAADFEAAMNRVQAALQTTDTELSQLSSLAKQMGETTKYSANEAALAIEMLGKNGLSTSQILGGALRSSMEVAASSGSDLSASSDVVTDVMMNFEKKAEDLGKVADGITGVLLQSKFGFDDYRLAIAQAGGVAGGLGVTLEDFNTAIAATSTSFAGGSDAGTSFKVFLSRLVPASESAANSMNRLGLEFFDAKGNMKSMAEIAEELQTGVSGLSDEAKNNHLQNIFGTDAIRTALQLSRQGESGFNTMQGKIGSASAAEQAAARMKGFLGELETLKSLIEGVSLNAGTRTMPALMDGLSAAKKLVTEIGDGLDGFAVKLDWSEIDQAKTAVAELGLAITTLLDADTSKSSVGHFFEGMAGAVNDIAAGVNAVDGFFKAMADPTLGIKPVPSDPKKAEDQQYAGLKDRVRKDMEKREWMKSSPLFGSIVPDSIIGDRPSSLALNEYQASNWDRALGDVRSDIASEQPAGRGPLGGRRFSGQSSQIAQAYESIKVSTAGGGATGVAGQLQQSLEAGGATAGTSIEAAGDAAAAKMLAALQQGAAALAAILAAGVKVNVSGGTLANRAPATTMPDAGKAGG